MTATPVMVVLEPGWPAWRTVARSLLARDVEPQRVQWLPPGGLWGAGDDDGSNDVPSSVKAPRRFMEIAQRVAHHREDERAPLLYRVLWRLTHGEPHLLDVAVDPDVLRLHALDAAVRRSAHKTQAFVRFRRVDATEGPHYVAWYAPEHPILPLVADFFADRFSDMRWTIMTPDASLDFDGNAWRMGPGQPRAAAPDADALEELWRSYYRSTFNPARLRLAAMQSEMPRRHWATLPETRDIPELVAQAEGRVEQMLDVTRDVPTAGSLIAQKDALPELAAKARECVACPLHRHATQVVFGRGPSDATIVIVGEQPGDTEDERGEPFCGPAGEVLDRALARAGVDRAQVYLTNAVKHFHHVREGKRRIHAKPRAEHVRACRPWLLAELERLRPRAIVCMGTTAARSLLGATVKVQRDRGSVIATPWSPAAIVTYHPSAVLRAMEREHADEVFESIVGDLVIAREKAVVGGA